MEMTQPKRTQPYQWLRIGWQQNKPMAITLWQALRGQSFTSPDGLTLGVCFGIAAQLGVVSALILRNQPDAVTSRISTLT